MSPTESIRTVLLEKYATFSGRATRPEFWWFWGASLLLSVVLFCLGLVTGMVDLFDGIDSLISLAILCPTVAVTCRRLHDINRSGWFQLLPLAPALPAIALVFNGAGFGDFLMIVLIGLTVILVILLLVWLIRAGEAGPNRFGDDPTNPPNDAEVFD